MSPSATAAPSARFSGFPAEAFEFYDALADNNTRAWWAEHKGEYQRYVREPLEALMGELAGEFGQPHLFRPHRDTRFSKDATPIKDHQGAVMQVEDAIAYYVQLSANGLMVGGGWYAPQGQQVARYRSSVEGPAGAELERILRSLRRRFTVDTNQVATRPRGYSADHPRLDLLRNRHLVAMRTHAADAQLGSRAALTAVRSDWRAIRPLVEWLADYVGPASDPGSDPDLD